VSIRSTIWRERLFRYAPLVFWVGVVLFLGSRQGALSQTSLFVRPILLFFFPDSSEETLLTYHIYIRKSAHFIEYGLLAFLSARAFTTSSRKFLSEKWFIVALLIVFCVSIIDEINQSFDPLRTGTPWDVSLDLAGGIFVLLLFAVFRRASRNF